MKTSAFESSVNSDGTQTQFVNYQYPFRFESSVNSDGTQTKEEEKARYTGLRVV